jgi:hypothetical protein
MIAGNPIRLVVGWYYPVAGDQLPFTTSDIAGTDRDMAQVGIIINR